jgi:hypothetical protein
MKQVGDFFRGKFYMLIISALVILPNIYVVVLGIENFPFTCAPMFAHYVNPETPLYIYKFEGIRNLKRELVKSDENGRPESVFMRQFFSKVYGSKYPVSPFGYHPDDSPEAFTLRMNEFFKHYGRYLLENKKKNYERIELILDKVDPSGKKLNSYLLGYFDVKEQHYFHLSGNIENP